MSMKRVNLSESHNSNSSKEVNCPSCAGKGCSYCHNSGVVSKAKASRYKSDSDKK